MSGFTEGPEYGLSFITPGWTTEQLSYWVEWRSSAPSSKIPTDTLEGPFMRERAIEFAVEKKEAGYTPVRIIEKIERIDYV